jgi:hypothetical protein
MLHPAMALPVCTLVAGGVAKPRPRGSVARSEGRRGQGRVQLEQATTAPGLDARSQNRDRPADALLPDSTTAWSGAEQGSCRAAAMRQAVWEVPKSAEMLRPPPVYAVLLATVAPWTT